MRWQPDPSGRISKNIEDQRFLSPEEKLAQAMNAARSGTIINPEIGINLPPWMWPDDTQLQQAALDKAAFQRAFGVER